MPRDYTKNSAGETVAYWRALLDRELKVWEEREPDREELRRITSDLDYGNLMASEEDEDPIDQRDYHIIPRYVDRLRATAGDESPEVRFKRSMVGIDPETKREVTFATVGEIQDRLVMRAMEQADAPGENQDGVAAVAVEGISVYWWEMTGLPDAVDASKARKGVKEVLAEASQGQHEPGRLDEHVELGGALTEASSADPEAIKEQVARTAPGEAPFEQVAMAGAEHLQAAEAEEKMPVFWEQGKFSLRCTRLPYGVWFRYDTSVTRHRDRRWYARLIHMDPDVARKFEGFRPSVRKQLVVSPLRNDDNLPITTIKETQGDPVAAAEQNGKVAIWQILDKKWGREYFIPYEGADEFLQERKAPFTDNEGRSYLKPAGSYPGFFPVAVCTPEKPTRDGPQKSLGNPLAKRGLKGAKGLIKLLSYYLWTMKQASAGYNFVAEEVYEEYEERFRLNRGGTYPKPQLPPGQDVMESYSWKPPSFQLFQQIDDEKSRVLEDLNFPQIQFSAQPTARTAEQERLANMSGSQGLFEAIRHMEVCYAEQAHICRAMLRVEHSDDKMVELIGNVDWPKLKKAWLTIGVTDELPDVVFAAKSRAQDRERAKLLMDLHERTKADVDPLTGVQTKKTDYLLDEAHKSLGVGAPEDYFLDDKTRFLLMKARAAAALEQKAKEAGATSSSGSKSSGSSASNGKTRDSEGKPRGRREKAGRRDSPRGRDRGSPKGSKT